MSNELYNDEIDRILHNYKRFKGCYMKDQLPQLEDHCYYIVNLQASTDGSGTHWCCLYVYGKIGIWFDPMGHGAPEEVEEKFEKIVYGDRDIQDYNASTCGYFCIGFVIFTYNSKNIFKAFKNYNNLFTEDLMRNDVVLKKLLGRAGDGIII